MIRKYKYPCVIKKVDDIYYVDFIDFEDCFTDADTIEEAFELADDVLSGVVETYITSGKDLPKPSFEIGDEGLIYIASCNINMERLENRSVKKTLSIPKWLNDEAVSKGINFSKVLQKALMELID